MHDLYQIIVLYGMLVYVFQRIFFCDKSGVGGALSIVKEDAYVIENKHNNNVIYGFTWKKDEKLLISGATTTLCVYHVEKE